MRVEQAISRVAEDKFSPITSQRDGIRRVPPAASRHRRQRPRRPRRHHGQGAAEERRVALATARAHPRHQQRLPGLPRRHPRGIHDQAYNVGRTGENYQIRDVATLVAEIVPDCEVGFAAGASADTRDYRVDFTKIEQRLPDYSPAWTVRTGIEELYAAYTGAGLSEADWERGPLLPAAHDRLAALPWPDRRQPSLRGLIAGSAGGGQPVTHRFGERREAHEDAHRGPLPDLSEHHGSRYTSVSGSHRLRDPDRPRSCGVRYAGPRLDGPRRVGDPRRVRRAGGRRPTGSSTSSPATCTS